jgi:hypothetical protein
MDNKNVNPSEIVEIEEFGKKNEEPPPASFYRVRIDKEKQIFNQRVVTGNDILEKAGKTPPTRWRLHQKIHGGQMIEIGYEDKVDLGAKGVERFTTFELSVGDGGFDV